MGQSYRELLDLHAHIHMLVSWGCFKKDGTFVQVKQVPSTAELEKLFRHELLRMLLNEEAIDESVVQNLLSWQHTGFSALVGHELPANDREAREAVARYLVHPPIALGRVFTEEKAEKVVYQGDKVHPRHGANFRIFDPLEFIAEVVSHIPNVHEKTAIHHRCYANKTREPARRRASTPRRRAPPRKPPRRGRVHRGRGVPGRGPAPRSRSVATGHD